MKVDIMWNFLGFIGLNPYYCMTGHSTSPECLYCPGTIKKIQDYLLQCQRQFLPRDEAFLKNSIQLE